MKTIATFATPEAAHLLRTRLESVDISAFVQEHGELQLEPFFSDKSHGVQVLVEDKDEAEALEFLATDVAPTEQEDGEITCPHCGSTDTVLDDEWHPRTLLQGMVNAPPPLAEHWLCRACEHSFEPQHEHDQPADSTPPAP
jgi:hypothetical protein